MPSQQQHRQEAIVQRTVCIIYVSVLASLVYLRSSLYLGEGTSLVKEDEVRPEHTTGIKLGIPPTIVN